MSFFKQHLPVWLTAIIGVLTILSFFMPHPLIADPAETLQNWAIVIVASGYVLGAANVLKVNGEDVVRQRTNWPYKIVLLASMIGMMIVGFFLSGGTHFLDAGTKFSWAYDNLYVPMQATMFALLAFFIASAAFRAFRIRTLEASLLAIAALVVMLGRVPLGDVLVRPLTDHGWAPSWLREAPLGAIQQWIMEVPQNAAKRAILIGAAMGVMATGLRVILGIERTYLAGGD